MNTPERNNINHTPLSEFEDSSVFNYLNSLSPIKPVKSVHIAQTLNSLSLSSPPSVFTSPHVNCHKESRFLRHNLLDSSKPKVSLEDVNKIYSREEAPTDSTHACHDSSKLQENTDQRISMGDSLIDFDPSSEYTKFELPQALKYDSGSPGCVPLLCSVETNSLLELPREPASDVAFVQQVSKRDSVEGVSQIEANIEGPDCDWDNLIIDSSDMLFFSSPTVTGAFKGLMNKPLDLSTRFSKFMTLLPQSTTNNGHKMHIANPVASGSEHEIENHLSEPISATDTGQTQENLANVALMAGNPSEEIDDELVHVTHHRIRRRCLDFEVASVQRNNSGDNSNISSITAKYDERNVGKEKPPLPRKRTHDSWRHALPGIGLHLNPLGTLKGYTRIKNEPMSPGRIIKLPSCISSFNLSASQERHQSLVPASLERDLEPSENEVQPSEDCAQSSVYKAGEDSHQNSPKKKRHKLEPAGEGEGCKRCNCKKSKCLKLYCECFAAGVYCIEPCSCQGCFNKPIHEDTVLQTRKQIESRNPLAFAPKVIRSSDSAPELGNDPNKTPASARHKRGCNCKKSSCLKKYCECYQGGVGCSISCRCEGCKNAYGRKDGSAPVEMKAEPEEVTEACEEGGVEKASPKTEIQNIEDHPDGALPTTPLRLSRPLLQLPFSSKGRSFVTTISGKPNALQSQSRFEKPFLQAVRDEDDDSAVTCIKTSSPNGKRISSSHFGPSPTRKGGRKLILQSIPSFPSLTPQNE